MAKPKCQPSDHEHPYLWWDDCNRRYVCDRCNNGFKLITTGWDTEKWIVDNSIRSWDTNKWVGHREVDYVQKSLWIDMDRPITPISPIPKTKTKTKTKPKPKPQKQNGPITPNCTKTKTKNKSKTKTKTTKTKRSNYS
eukprot:429556_1